MRQLGAIAFALAMTAVAAAQPSDKDKQQASGLVKQAIAKSQAGDHNKAIELYEEAYKIIPQPLLLSNIGSEYQASEKPVEALKYFCKYLEAEPNGSNAGFAKSQAKKLYTDLNDLEDVEDHEICKPIEKKPPDEKKPPEPVADEGSITDVGPEPESKQPKPKRASDDGGELRWIGVGVGVLGAGAVGLGFFFGRKAQDISEEISNHDLSTPWPDDIRTREADGKSYEKKQIGFMAAGGVAVAIGVVLFVVGGPKATDTSTQVSITPIATPDTMGFAASGRF
jgi:tetratricopeptide (TPR) repeat protein